MRTIDISHLRYATEQDTEKLDLSDKDELFRLLNKQDAKLIKIDEQNTKNDNKTSDSSVWLKPDLGQTYPLYET